MTDNNEQEVLTAEQEQALEEECKLDEAMTSYETEHCIF
jgi:hypothetical protein